MSKIKYRVILEIEYVYDEFCDEFKAPTEEDLKHEFVSHIQKGMLTPNGDEEIATYSLAVEQG